MTTDGPRSGRSPSPPTGPGGAAVPSYGTGSLVELMPSVSAALGVPGFQDVLGVADLLGAAPGEIRRACVLLVDGLGWTAVRAHSASAPRLAALPGRPVTSAFPATTAVSIASLGTGLPPGAHGIVGYQARIPGTGRLMNSLRWDREVAPTSWQPHPTVFTRVHAAGVAARHVGPRAHAGGGLTVAATASADYCPADTMGELTAEAVAATTVDDWALTYAYHRDLDATGHARGCGSSAWLDQLRHVDLLVDALVANLPRDAFLVVTGDHGMIDVPPEGRVDVRAEPALLDGVELLGGEGRARHVYTRAGAADDVVATWREVLADRAMVASRAEAVAAGWFGPEVSDRILERLGDVVVSCRASTAIVDTDREPIESMLIGLHGGMEPAEQLVPMLVTRGEGTS